MTQAAGLTRGAPRQPQPVASAASFLSKLAAASLSLCVLSPLSCSKPLDRGTPDKEVRNVILVSIDTLRADHLGCYGYGRNTSPFIDEMASRGAIFLNAFSSSSWTVPAHATMFTGLDPLVHGALRYPHATRLPNAYSTLAEILSAQGFRTAAFTGGGYVSPAFGLTQGFQVFSTRGRHFEANLPDALQWVRLNRNERFFLFLHGYNVHKPYKPPPPYNTLFSEGYKGGYDTENFQPDKPRPSAEDLRFVISQYDGEIRYADDQLRHFFGELEITGALADTVVIVTSDHGDEFYEHGGVDHIHTLYDELLRVPLVVAGPGIRATRFKGQVGLIDLVPTVLGLLRLDSKEPVQGSDLSPFLFNGSDSLAHEVYSVTGFSDYPYELLSIRTPRWKLILWKLEGMREVKLDDRQPRELYTCKFRTDRLENFAELFLVSRDRAERRDLADTYGRVRSALARRLATRIEQDAELAKKTGEEHAVPGAKEIEALKALGYL